MGQYYFPVISRVRDTEIKGAEDIIMYTHPNEWDEGLKLMEHSYKGVDMVDFICSVLADNPQHLTWAGDYADEIDALQDNLHGFCYEHDEVKHSPKPTDHDNNLSSFPFFLDHDNKQWFDIRNTKGEIHPLPLLTANSNGLGGGDYYSEIGKDFVGSWSGDLIEVRKEPPTDDGWEEIVPQFKEEY